MKKDLVYILGSESRWSDNEIRYSLRSAEKFFDFGRVFVVGEIPEWMTGVVHLPVRDPFSNKLKNARSKYLAACAERSLSAEFVLMNDDFFFLERTDEIPAYSRGTLAGMIERHPTQKGYYFDAMRATRHRLDGMGVDPVLDFEVHAPMVFDKARLASIAGMVGEEKPYLLRTCYGNLANLEREDMSRAALNDFKAANLTEFVHQTSRTRPFLSINDALVASVEFRTWIARKFPKPSRFELDAGRGASAEPGMPQRALRYHATTPFTYGRRSFSSGDVIDADTMKGIKTNAKMRRLWILK